jgi:hypothetical protein
MTKKEEEEKKIMMKQSCRAIPFVVRCGYWYTEEKEKFDR